MNKVNRIININVYGWVKFIKKIRKSKETEVL